MSICSFWNRIRYRRGAKAEERATELEDDLKVAEYRNMQAYDLLHEALESLLDAHVAEEPAPSDPDTPKEDQ